MVTIGRFFDWFQLALFICLLILATRRMFWMRAQGARIIVLDRQRTGRQLMADLVAVICLCLWGGEIISQALLHHALIAPSLLVIPIDWIAPKLLGIAIEIAGLCIYAVALRDMGISWRLGIDRAKPGPLVTNGIYSRIRHPIYVSLDMLFVGTFLVLGNAVLLGIAIVMALLLHAIMHREEQYLAQQYGAAYLDYCSSVGRYWTWN